MEVYLVRHAESETNAANSGKVAGQTNWSELTPRGVGQARQLGLKFLGESVAFSEIFSSTAIRAQQTARYCLVSMGVDIHMEDAVHLDSRLLELSQGDFVGILRSEIYRRPDVREALDTDPWTFIPGDVVKGESQAAVAFRMKDWFEEVALKHPHGRVLVFSHDVAIKVFLAEILQENKADAYKSHVGNASVTVIRRSEDGEIRCIIRNDISHLREE
jgi:broad specificity phosphatase PhoE